MHVAHILMIISTHLSSSFSKQICTKKGKEQRSFFFFVYHNICKG